MIHPGAAKVAGGLARARSALARISLSYKMDISRCLTFTRRKVYFLPVCVLSSLLILCLQLSKHYIYNMLSNDMPPTRYAKGQHRQVAWWRTSPRNFDRICVWAYPLSLLCFFLIFCTGGFLPPIAPSKTAEEVVAHYRKHDAGIKAGAAIMQFSGPFYCLFVAAISGQMSRIPGCSHAMIITQAINGCISAFVVTLPGYFFCLVGYRLDRPPEITMLLNDICWFLTVIPFATNIGQNFAFSYAILMDKREKPLFPHWFAWFSTVWPLCYWGALGMHAVKGGAFAWDGGYTFWVGAVGTGIGQGANMLYLLKAIARDDDDQPLPSMSGMSHDVGSANQKLPSSENTISHIEESSSVE